MISRPSFSAFLNSFNAWAAQDQPDGLYYYLLTNATTGQQYKGWVEVRR